MFDILLINWLIELYLTTVVYYIYKFIHYLITHIKFYKKHHFAFAINNPTP